MSIAHLRREYTLAGLTESDLEADAIAQFEKWFEQAVAAGVKEPNAMTLATVDAAGQPSARVVLLKDISPQGFSFFTNHESRKGRELAANPKAALVLHWAELERQVCISGQVSRLPRAEAEAYFKVRPRGSRLGAWVSRQSEVISGRAILEERLAQLEAQYPGDDIPLPPHWGGYLLAPTRIEFWQGRPNRLHDRLRYSRSAPNGWKIERLSP